MNVSLEAKIDNVFNEFRIAESDIRAGKLVDLTPLESRIKGVCYSISDKEKQSRVADPGTLQSHLTALLVRLENLEKLVTAKKKGLVPPKFSQETS